MYHTGLKHVVMVIAFIHLLRLVYLISYYQTRALKISRRKHSQYLNLYQKKNNKLSLEDLLLIKCDQKYFKETIWNNSNTVIATYIRVTSILRIIVKNEFKQQDIFGLMQETLTRDKDGKENITFGIAIVRLLRVLAFKNLKINRKRIIGGITLESIIEGSFNKNLNKTKQMGEEADLNRVCVCLTYLVYL